MKRIIQTSKAPAPVGPYNQAIAAGNFIFTAGQIPINPETGKLVTGDIRAQTRQVIENLRAVLKEADADLSDVVKITVFLKNMDDFSVMNEVYATFFSENSPARSAVEVARLPKDVAVEMECVAVLTGA